MTHPKPEHWVDEMFDHKPLLRLVEVAFFQRTLADRRIAGSLKVVGNCRIADAQTTSDAAQDSLLEISKRRCRVRRIECLEVNASRKLMERASLCVVKRCEGVFISICGEAVASGRCEEAHFSRANAGRDQFSLTIAVQHLQRWHGRHCPRHTSRLIGPLLNVNVQHSISRNPLTECASGCGCVIIVAGVVHQHMIGRNTARG